MLAPALEADNRAEFRRIVLEGYPEALRLVALLRDLTPAQHTLITGPLRRRWRDADPAAGPAADPAGDSAAGDPAARAALAAEINAWHRVFADYVHLLNAMEQRLSALHAAVADPRRSLLDRASAGTADLILHAEALRRSVAALRASRWELRP